MTCSPQLIDVWLLFFLISTTINILIHILVDFLRKSELEFERIHGAQRPTTVKVGEAYMHGEVMVGMGIDRMAGKSNDSYFSFKYKTFTNR